MDPEERATGTPNEEYNLVSVLYHALHGAETCQMYARDAEAAGDDDLASFFRNVQATHRQVAQQAKARLYTTGEAATPGTAEARTSTPPEGMVGPEAPPTPRESAQPGENLPPPGDERQPEPPPRPTPP